MRAEDIRIMKELILVRGLPGSGKSTLGRIIAPGSTFEADQFFVDPITGEYVFDASQLSEAHKYCFAQVHMAMKDGVSLIVVSNTFTREWEMAQYFTIGHEYGYRITSLIVENRHGGTTEHGVPPEHIAKMQERFEISL